MCLGTAGAKLEASKRSQGGRQHAADAITALPPTDWRRSDASADFKGVERRPESYGD
jgi:hypothetical protein